MNDAQRQEIDDAAFVFLVKAKGMQEKTAIVRQIWYSSGEKGLRVLGKLVDDTPKHLAYVGHIGLLKQQNSRKRRHRKPLGPAAVTEQDVCELLKNDQVLRDRRDASAFGRLETIKFHGHGQRKK